MNREENLILPNLTKLICDGKEREIVPVYKTDKGEYVVSGTELHRILGVRSRYPMRRKTPCFSYGDIRRVHRIYASN